MPNLSMHVNHLCSFDTGPPVSFIKQRLWGKDPPDSQGKEAGVVTGRWHWGTSERLVDDILFPELRTIWFVHFVKIHQTTHTCALLCTFITLHFKRKKKSSQINPAPLPGFRPELEVQDEGFRLHKREKLGGDFLCGPVVKKPPSNAGDVGSIPGWGTKIPHASG